nr:orf109 [Ipomoea batatas]
MPALEEILILTIAMHVGPSLIGKSLPFPSNDPASPGSSTVWAPFPPYAMLPRRRPTTLRACVVFARRSLPVVPSSPLAVWAGCPSLLHSVRLWITGTNVVEWNSRRVTRSTVPRCEVQVVMITPGYALAPLTGTPEPANAR